MFFCHLIPFANMTFFGTFLSFVCFVLLPQNISLVAITPPGTNPDTNPICIVGGGLSGLTIANLLQNRGQNVHLYEGEGRFGGKILTLRTPSGEPLVERGAIMHSSLMPYATRYFAKYNLTSVPLSRKNAVEDSALFNPGTGSIFSDLAVFFEDLPLLTEQYREAYDEATNGSAALASGYLNLSEDQIQDLSTPIEYWLDRRNLSELTPYFVTLLTTLGYGDVKDTPALYALKMIRGSHAQDLFHDWKHSLGIKEGTDALIERMSATVENKHLGWRATEIRREVNENGGNLQTIVFDRGEGGQVEVNCSRTVLAFPPLLRNIVGLVSNLSVPERETFNLVRVVKYAESPVNMGESLKLGIYSDIIPQLRFDEESARFETWVKHPSGDGGVISIGRSHHNNANRSYYTAYSWLYGDYDDQCDQRDLTFMEKKLNDTIKKIDPSAVPLTKLRTTQFFPHVTTRSIKAGFFKDFAALQGLGGLYYATTLLTFECMDGAIEMAEDFVQKYF